jgi:probable rRNA maturation factor
MRIFIQNRQRHRPLNNKKIEKAARQILSVLEQPAAELSVLFVGDSKMRQLNSAYRGIINSTDVLSFEARLPAGLSEFNVVLGDVVINVPRAESQAKTYGTGFYDEIYRLLIHGTLHLTGYDHEGSRYKARKMRAREQEIFDAVKKMA